MRIQFGCGAATWCADVHSQTDMPESISTSSYFLAYASADSPITLFEPLWGPKWNEAN